MSQQVNQYESRSERLLALASRVAVWAILFLFLWVLRSFFLLLFLTFVFAYLQSSAEQRLKPLFPSRPVRVVAVALSLLLLLMLLGTFLLPRFREQATNFALRYPNYLMTLDQGLYDLRARYPGLQEFLPERPPGELPTTDLRRSPSAAFMQQLLGVPAPNDEASVRQLFSAVRDVGGLVVGIVSAFLLSLLFSFLIVLDLPKLIAGARELANTKLGFVYEEVAGSIYDFGRVVGRALEAQVIIAFINTALTAVGLVVLGLGEQVAFLSVIVFICSFIPVAGVFISSVPICLLALQESGVSMMLFAILLITVIHLIEAYILNPRVYGHHLRMNPVVVLIILTLGGKLFHVWGLILGVPVCNYLFSHAIRYRDSDRVA